LFENALQDLLPSALRCRVVVTGLEPLRACMMPDSLLGLAELVEDTQKQADGGEQRGLQLRLPNDGGKTPERVTRVSRVHLGRAARCDVAVSADRAAQNLCRDVAAAAPGIFERRLATGGGSCPLEETICGTAGRAVGSSTPSKVVQGTPNGQGCTDQNLDIEKEAGSAGPNFASEFANVLDHLASLAQRPQRLTRFHAVRAPQLSIRDYMQRIATYFQCSDECFVLGLVYIDRIVKRHPEFVISNLSIHRLLVTSVMLAAKFFDDVYYSNAYYGKVGGVKTSELNALEAQFLKLIDWRLHVRPLEYDSYRLRVLAAHKPQESGACLSLAR